MNTVFAIAAADPIINEKDRTLTASFLLNIDDSLLRKDKIHHANQEPARIDVHVQKYVLYPAEEYGRSHTTKV
jgi:hypothetical protein